jgi:DNA-binding beta-propeller fold protein YncE
VSFFVGDVQHCEIDGAIPTAGGIAVDRNGDVYVSSNRPDGSGGPSGVWRYSGRFPSSPAECNAAFLAANLHKELVVPITPVLPADPFAPTPSAVVVSPEDTLYVSSVFSGTVSEFTKKGRWVRDIWPLSPVSLRRGPTGETPYGLAVTADGALWIADLGIILDAPVDGQGSVISVRFGEKRNPQMLGSKRRGLTFPDGLGVYTPRG